MMVMCERSRPPPSGACRRVYVGARSGTYARAHTDQGRHVHATRSRWAPSASTLNVSGYSFFNDILVENDSTFLSSLNVSGFTSLNNRTTVISSLNVSGFTTLNNTTNINGALYVSGLNVLETLNHHTTDISTLFGSNVDVLETLNNYSTDFSILFGDSTNTLQIVNNHSTDLSTLYNFRDDNPNALITLEYDSTIIHGILSNS